MVHYSVVPCTETSKQTLHSRARTSGAKLKTKKGVGARAQTTSRLLDHHLPPQNVQGGMGPKDQARPCRTTVDILGSQEAHWLGNAWNWSSLWGGLGTSSISIKELGGQS